MSRRVVRELAMRLAEAEMERDYLRRERDRLIAEQFKENRGRHAATR